MGLAPIALFVYNRPEHTRKTIAALKKNTLAATSDLIIFSDASKTSQSDSSVQEVRAILKSIDGFKSIKIIERDENWGLSRSIIDGVSRICSEYGRVIVLEDDLVTSPYFLKFMNDGLDCYESEASVVSVHGYIYPLQTDVPATFFLRGADCWGWATWKRGWDIFEPDARKLYDAVQASGEIKTFDFDGNYAYAEMLKQQINGKVNSWAIRWYASAFLANKLTLYPGISLVQNIGNDSTGTHRGDTGVFSGQLADRPAPVGNIPVVSNSVAYVAVSHYFKSLRLPMMQRLGRKILALRR